MKKLSSFLGPFSSGTESVIKSQPVLFSLIILYQGLFSHKAFELPENVSKIFENKVVRFLSVVLISFTATQDVEYALISTVLFLSIMYLLKTPEERKKTGFI